MLGENMEKFKNENKYHNNLKEYRKEISFVFFKLWLDIWCFQHHALCLMNWTQDVFKSSKCS